MSNANDRKENWIKVDGELTLMPPDADAKIPKEKRLEVATFRCHNCIHWHENEIDSEMEIAFKCNEVDTGCWLYAEIY